jgi:hypothetical protein
MLVVASGWQRAAAVSPPSLRPQCLLGQQSATIFVSTSAQLPARRAVLRACASDNDDDPVIIDVEVQEVIDAIVVEELKTLGEMTPEEQEERLPELLSRVERRAAEERGYQFGDLSKGVVESVRGEVQRQMTAEWSGDDISLLLKIGLFLGAGAAAPVAGIAALPAAAVLATYGTVLKAELGVRAVQEVGTRLTERAARGIVDGVKIYTGKEECMNAASASNPGLS